MFGFGLKTPYTLRFGAEPPSIAQPSFTTGGGDGVVPESGLRLCEQWQHKQSQQIAIYPFANISHAGLVDYPAAIEVLLKSLL